MKAAPIYLLVYIGNIAFLYARLFNYMTAAFTAFWMNFNKCHDVTFLYFIFIYIYVISCKIIRLLASSGLVCHGAASFLTFHFYIEIMKTAFERHMRADD